MDQITIEGTVHKSNQNKKGFYFRVAEKDVDRFKKFVKEETGTTHRGGDHPVGVERIYSKCEVGDYIELIIGTQRRKDKITLKNIDFNRL